MTDIEKSKLEMYDTILQFLSENRNITVNVKAFVWSIIKFRRKVDEIRVKEKEFLSEALHKTIRVTKARDELISAMIPMASALSNYAKEINDPELKQKTRLTQSGLVRSLDCELMEKAVSIRLLAEKHLKELKKRGIRSSELRAIKVKAENFKSAQNNKIAGFISSNTILAISNLFADADKMLCSYIDNFAEALSDQYPEFYNEYLFVRNIAYQEKKRGLHGARRINKSKESEGLKENKK